MSSCIEVNNLTKTFGERTVVDGLSFRVQRGEVNCCTTCGNYFDLWYGISKDVSLGVDDE